MTHGEAANQFEKMWREVSPQVREKYARQAGVVKPVEKRESAKDMYARQRESRMRDQAYRVGVPATATAAAKPTTITPIPKNTPISQLDPSKTYGPATTMSFEQLTDPKQEFQAVGDGSSAATGWKPTVGEDGKPIKSFGPGSFGFSFKDDAQSAVNFIHGRGFKPNTPPAAPTPPAPVATDRPQFARRGGASPSAVAARGTVQTPGPFANAARRGGTSVSGQQGRISSGASPSAPIEVRNQVAANAGVKPVMPDQVAAPAPAPTVAKKPLGATPAGMELTGMKGGVPQYTPIEEVYGERALTKPPMLPKSDNDIRADYQNRNQTPMMRNGADNAMRSQGMVVQSPVAKPVVGPARMAETSRSDGYVARGVIEAGRMQAENVRNDTTGAPRAVPVGASPVVRPTNQLQKPNRFALVRR
jgi:hypothetical protein